MRKNNTHNFRSIFHDKLGREMILESKKIMKAFHYWIKYKNKTNYIKNLLSFYTLSDIKDNQTFQSIKIV